MPKSAKGAAARRKAEGDGKAEGEKEEEPPTEASAASAAAARSWLSRLLPVLSGVAVASAWSLLALPERLDAAGVAGVARAGAVVSEALTAAGAKCVAGASALDVDAAAAAVIRSNGARSAAEGYGRWAALPAAARHALDVDGYPAQTCVSVNEAAVHGVPRADVVLEEGDLVSVDVALELDGWFADACYTFVVPGGGPLPEDRRRALSAAHAAFNASLAACRAGATTGDLGHASAYEAERLGGTVVTRFSGHGVGRKMHGAPRVPGKASRRSGHRLRAGEVITIEPVVTAGATTATSVLADGWTHVTADGAPAAQFEATVAVVEGGCAVLTPHPKAS